MIRGISTEHADIYNSTFGFEASRFRFYEFLLNCANFEKETVVFDVNIDPLMVSA